MDPDTKGVVQALAAVLTNDPEKQKSIIGCFQSKCQVAQSKCRAQNGPCRPHPLRIQSIRECKALKRTIINEGGDGCAEKCATMYEKYSGKSSLSSSVKGMTGQVGPF
jgi:hypothetical protein